MRRVAVVVAAAAVAVGAPPRARAAAAGAPALSPEEEAFCAQEVDVVERRDELFRKQGLPAAEIARKNEPQLRALVECRDRYRAQQRRATEQRQDLAEVERRLGADATEIERDRVYREIRRERLASKPTSQLTREEKAELAEGMQDELAATHAAMDSAHARDPAFMRIVHSAVSCYHGDRKADLQNQIASEEALLKLGSGDRKRLYALRSDLRQNEEVLERTREESGGRALERCSSPTVALVTHCLGIRLERRQPDPMCDSEQIQQYVRFVK